MSRTAQPHRVASSAPLRRRVAGAIAVLTLGVATLTGCAAGRISQTADQISDISGAQGTIGQVGVHNALLATPSGPDYPKGATAQLQLWVSNDAQTADTLTAISTDAGSVTIDGAATIPAQGIIDIGGAGAKVTAAITSLTRDLPYGISVPMTFSFANAGDLKLNVPIETPAERVSTRATTNMYPEETPNLWQTTEGSGPVTTPAGQGQ